MLVPQYVCRAFFTVCGICARKIKVFVRMRSHLCDADWGSNVSEDGTYPLAKRHKRVTSHLQDANRKAVAHLHLYGRYKVYSRVWFPNVSSARNTRFLQADHEVQMSELPTSHRFPFRCLQGTFSYATDTMGVKRDCILVNAYEVLQKKDPRNADERFRQKLQEWKHGVHYWTLDDPQQKLSPEENTWVSYFEFWPANKHQPWEVLRALERPDLSDTFRRMVEPPGMFPAELRRVLSSYDEFSFVNSWSSDRKQNMIDMFDDEKNPPGLADCPSEIFTQVPTDVVTYAKGEAYPKLAFVEQGMTQITSSSEFKNSNTRAKIVVDQTNNNHWQMVQQHRDGTVVDKKFDVMMSFMAMSHHKLSMSHNKLTNQVEDMNAKLDLLIERQQNPVSTVTVEELPDEKESTNDFTVVNKHGYRGVWFRNKFWVPARVGFFPSERFATEEYFRTSCYRDKSARLTSKSANPQNWARLMCVLGLQLTCRTLYSIALQ